MEILLGNSYIADYNLLGATLSLRDKLPSKGNIYKAGSGSTILALSLAMNLSISDILYIYDFLLNHSKDFRWDRYNLKKLLEPNVNTALFSLRKILLAQFTEVTFQGLKEKYGNELVVITYNIAGNFELFDIKRTPDMSVIDAMLLSMSLPGKYSVGLYNGGVYVDPTIVSRYPNHITSYNVGIFIKKKYHNCIDAIINSANEQYTLTSKDIGIKELNSDSVTQLLEADRHIRRIEFF